MFNPVWKAISRLGFYVLGITCDRASTNRCLWKLHGVVSKQEELTYKVLNPFTDGHSHYIYSVSDPPHPSMTTRNSLHNNKRQLWASFYSLS